MIDFENPSYLKLRPVRDSKLNRLVEPLLSPGEEILQTFQSVRDGVVFTTRKVIAVNVQGVTGMKKAYTVLPYRRVQAYAIESAGLADLDGRDLIFADPMNATGGSLVTIVKYLESEGIRPRSIKFINVISALKGALRVARALPEAEIFTLWMDPVLNDSAYIMPGLGDAGDRLNGADGDEPRNIIQLIADYGQNLVNLYRSQVRQIEKTVLG